MSTHDTTKATSKGFKRLMKRWLATATPAARSVFRSALREPTGYWPMHTDIVANEVKGATAWWVRKGG